MHVENALIDCEAKHFAEDRERVIRFGAARRNAVVGGAVAYTNFFVCCIGDGKGAQRRMQTRSLQEQHWSGQ